MIPLRLIGMIGGPLAALALIGGAFWLHSNAISSAHDSAYAAGVKAERDRAALAQADADRKATAHVAIVAAKQSAISKDASNALFQTDDAIDARAHALSVRHGAATAAPRQSGDLPATGTAAGQSCPSAAEDGLPWSVALPLMTQAAKDLAQLNAVLDHEEAQDALATETAK